MGSRRTKGTGSVYQLPNGKYIGQARLQGNRRSTSVCKTEREAEKLLRQILSEADKGIILSAEKWTVAQRPDRSKGSDFSILERLCSFLDVKVGGLFVYVPGEKGGENE